MNQYFILIYAGKDLTPKYRILKESSLSEEMSVKDSALFKNNEVHLVHGPNCFYSYMPHLTFEKNFEFNPYWPSRVFGITNEVPWNFIKDLDQEGITGLYQAQMQSLIDEAFCQRQMSCVN